MYVYASERNERASKIFAFSHSKPAISFNILFVGTSDTLSQEHNIFYFRCQITSAYTYTQCSSFYYLWYGDIYKRQYHVPTKH